MKSYTPSDKRGCSDGQHSPPTTSGSWVRVTKETIVPTKGDQKGRNFFFFFVKKKAPSITQVLFFVCILT